MVTVEGMGQTSFGRTCCEGQVTGSPATTLGTLPPTTFASMWHFPGWLPKAKYSRVLELGPSCQGTLPMGNLSRRLAGDQ